MADWDVDKAIEHLNQHSGLNSLGQCAHYVRLAIQAGGVNINATRQAKDYGPNLQAAGFHALGVVNPERGDVAVIQPVPGHPDGHMAMFNGTIWVSDFKQPHDLYPAAAYRKYQPDYVIYRMMTSDARDISRRPPSFIPELN